MRMRKAKLPIAKETSDPANVNNVLRMNTERGWGVGAAEKRNEEILGEECVCVGARAERERERVKCSVHSHSQLLHSLFYSFVWWMMGLFRGGLHLPPLFTITSTSSVLPPKSAFEKLNQREKGARSYLFLLSLINL